MNKVSKYPGINYGDYVQMNDRFETCHIWSEELESVNDARFTPIKITEKQYMDSMTAQFALVQPSAAMRWVKASERLPVYDPNGGHNYYCCKVSGAYCGLLFKRNNWFESVSGYVVRISTIEWLDESPATRTVNDLTDEECLKGCEILGNCSHLSEESRIYQFRELFTDLFYRQSNISGSTWFKLKDYLKSINVTI